jgi:hypothetical protein
LNTLSFSDIDLCVAPENYESASLLLEKVKGVQLSIDLHKGLRHLDTVGWDTLFENSVMVSLDGVPIRVLRTEDHLRVLCVHWLTDGGVYKDRLLDIYYLVKKNADTFDWEYCFRGIAPYRRDWIVKTITVVHKFYPLDISKLPFAEQLIPLPGWFSKALDRAWATDTRLHDIQTLSGNKAELWKQIKLRIRPNPIQAAVMMEGKFEKSHLLYYQVGSFIYRFKSSFKRGVRSLRNKS